MKTLDDQAFVAAIRRDFRYLFQSGFSITEQQRERRHVFWVLLDGTYRLRIGSDIDGHVYLALAPLGTPREAWKKWTYLEVVIYMLTEGKTNLDYLDSGLDQEFVLSVLSRQLYKHLDAVSHIFSGENPGKYEATFRELRREMTDIHLRGKQT
jgi:hypothetical protein